MRDGRNVIIELWTFQNVRERLRALKNGKNSVQNVLKGIVFKIACDDTFVHFFVVLLSFYH